MVVGGFSKLFGEVKGTGNEWGTLPAVARVTDRSLSGVQRAMYQKIGLKW